MFASKSNLHIDATDSSYFGYYLYNYTGSYTANLKTHHKTGVDVDLIGGYDFGMFRLEAELGYKRAKHDHYSLGGFGSVEADGRTSAYSAMINALIDFGRDDGLNFSVGGGVGYAKTKYRFSIDDPDTPDIDGVSASLKDSGFAWQLIAAARYAEWEITGPAEIRHVDPDARAFSPHRPTVGKLGPLLRIAEPRRRIPRRVPIAGVAS